MCDVLKKSWRWVFDHLKNTIRAPESPAFKITFDTNIPRYYPINRILDRHLDDVIGGEADLNRRFDSDASRYYPINRILDRHLDDVIGGEADLNRRFDSDASRYYPINRILDRHLDDVIGGEPGSRK